MPRAKKTSSMPPQVNGFVVSLRPAPDLTLAQVRAAILAVTRHLGALCAELGGPDLAKSADLIFSVDQGLFLVGTQAPEGVAAAWPQLGPEGKIPGPTGTGPGTEKLRAEARAMARGRATATKAKRGRDRK